MYLRSTGIELGLLLHDAAAHVLDDGHIFAAQAAQLHHLLRQIPPSNVHGTTSLVLQLDDAGSNRRAQNFLPLPHDPLSQRMLKAG